MGQTNNLLLRKRPSNTANTGQLMDFTEKCFKTARE
jgi:hypothetical protein